MTNQPDRMKRLEELLAHFPAAKVGLLGDYCVDVYWELRPAAGEPSLETGLRPNMVTASHYSLGGGGNVLANLAAAGARRITAFGFLGLDPFGVWARGQMETLAGTRQPGLLEAGAPFVTPIYCKPLLNGVEMPRFDLGWDNRLPESASEELLGKIAAAAPGLKLLAINQQFLNGVNTPWLRERLMPRLKQANPALGVTYDGRDLPGCYPGAILKLNARSASELAFSVPGRNPAQAIAVLYRQRQTPLVVTDGEHGCYVADETGIDRLDAIHEEGPTDIVGAGDAFFATFSLALAIGGSLRDAAMLGTCAAAVTVHKLHQTGTASPAELTAKLPLLSAWAHLEV